jgi:hypothetical protein
MYNAQKWHLLFSFLSFFSRFMIAATTCSFSACDFSIDSLVLLRLMCSFTVSS